MSHWNVYRNNSVADENGEYGVDYWGVRHPDTHRIVLSDKKASEERPDQDPMEFLEGQEMPSATQEGAENPAKHAEKVQRVQAQKSDRVEQEKA